MFGKDGQKAEVTFEDEFKGSKKDDQKAFEDESEGSEKEPKLSYRLARVFTIEEVRIKIEEFITVLEKF
ncbi:unnamed protein product [Rhizophagus irregularis]|nr:unnamed protein product [Rhizophagus irregularis]